MTDATPNHQPGKLPARFCGPYHSTDIPSNDFGIEPRHYLVNELVQLLRDNRNRPEVVCWLAGAVDLGDYRIFLPESECGFPIEERYYHISEFFELLIKFKDEPDTIHFLADMLEE